MPNRYHAHIGMTTNWPKATSQRSVGAAKLMHKTSLNQNAPNRDHIMRGFNFGRAGLRDRIDSNPRRALKAGGR